MKPKKAGVDSMPGKRIQLNDGVGSFADWRARIHVFKRTFSFVEGSMRILKKRADGYVDAARLHAGRIVYCSKEEVADDHGLRLHEGRSMPVTRPRSDGHAFASGSNLHPR
jgi:hypothetical protein